MRVPIRAIHKGINIIFTRSDHGELTFSQVHGPICRTLPFSLMRSPICPFDIDQCGYFLIASPVNCSVLIFCFGFNPSILSEMIIRIISFFFFSVIPVASRIRIRDLSAGPFPAHVSYRSQIHRPDLLRSGPASPLLSISISVSLPWDNWNKSEVPGNTCPIGGSCSSPPGFFHWLE